MLQAICHVTRERTAHAAAGSEYARGVVTTCLLQMLEDGAHVARLDGILILTRRASLICDNMWNIPLTVHGLTADVSKTVLFCQLDQLGIPTMTRIAP